MLRLRNKIDRRVQVNEMKDGDVGVIVGWAVSDYVGQIVQRYKDDLITLGASSRNSFPNLFFGGRTSSGNIVELLKPGDTLVME